MVTAFAILAMFFKIFPDARGRSFSARALLGRRGLLSLPIVASPVILIHQNRQNLVTRFTTGDSPFQEIVAHLKPSSCCITFKMFDMKLSRPCSGVECNECVLDIEHLDFPTKLICP